MILLTDCVDFWESVGFKATDNRDNNGQPDLFVTAIKFKTEMNPFRPIGFNLLYFLVFFTTPTETNFQELFTLKISNNYNDASNDRTKNRRAFHPSG